MNIRTDLAVEQLEQKTSIPDRDVTHQEEIVEGVRITRVMVKSERGAKQLQKPKGNYVTLELDSLQGFSLNFEGETSVLSRELQRLLPREGLILAVGLGNADITPDAVGPLVSHSLLATRHLAGETAKSIGLDHLRPVAVVSPGVLGQTGMETAEVVESLCRQIQPVAVLAVDALASRSIDRLGRTVQISDTGISPGSGVQNQRKELSSHTLGVPVIAVGIPTVVDMATIAYDLAGHVSQNNREKSMMVTPREIDQLVKQSAKLVAAGINAALQPTLTMEEIIGLTA